MVDLTIIYTPEADLFRLNDKQMHELYHLGDPVLDKLRGSYQRLREVARLSDKVGVVTFDQIWKQKARKDYEELIDDGLIEVTTTYTPLDIFRAITALRNEHPDLIDAEADYRMLSYLISCNQIAGDRDLFRNTRMTLLHSVVPKLVLTRNQYREAGKMLDKSCPLGDSIAKVVEELPSLANWDDFSLAQKYLQDRFEANGVSEGFPLYYIAPRSWSFLYTVSLTEIIERPENMGIEVLERYADRDEEARKLLVSLRQIRDENTIDRFAETKMRFDFGRLIQELPEPKTIITDIYIVDQHPQIAEMDFETIEFRLE